MKKIAEYLEWPIVPIKAELPFFLAVIFCTYLPHFINEIESPQPLFWELRWMAICVANPVAISYLLTCVVWISKSKLLKTILLAMVFFLMFVNLFLLFNFYTLLSPWILLLIVETNANESSEFLSQYAFTAGTFISLSFTLLLIVSYVQFEKNKFTLKRKWQRTVLFLCLMGVLPVGTYMLYKTIQLPLLDTQLAIEEWYEQRGSYANNNTITNIIYSSHYLNVSGADNQKAIQSSLKAANQSAQCLEQDSLNVVLVIGESFSKHHASVYGYRLNTTPTLCNEQKKGNLFVFHDAVAPYNMTTFSVKNMFSVNCLSKGEPWYSKPMFPVIFKKSGYHVTIWDNQKPSENVNSYDYSVGSYLYAPQIVPVAYNETNSKTSQYDLPFVQSLKQTNHQQAKHNLVIIHLMGQHSDAAQRFPNHNKYNVFKVADISANVTEAQKQSIADYDNATLYNDLVIQTIMNMYKTKSTVLLYLSDHGEEVYDYRNHLGRTHERKKTPLSLKYQYQIPFVVWCSDKYIEKHPDKAISLRQATEKPFLSSDISHMLFSLGAIKTPFYMPDKDILNEQYQCGKRMVQQKTDYDRTIKEE